MTISGERAFQIAKDTGQILLSGAFGAGMGYLGARWSKTNAVAAAIIGGSQELLTGTVGCVVKHTMGETRNAKIVIAVSSFLIGTIATIASVILGAATPGMAAFSGALLIIMLGWNLYEAFQIAAEPVVQQKMEQAMKVVVETGEPKCTDAATDVSPKDPQQDAVVHIELDNSMEAFKLAMGRFNMVPGQIDVKNQSLGDNPTEKLVLV